MTAPLIAPHYLLIDAPLFGIRLLQVSTQERKLAPADAPAWAQNVPYETGTKNMEVQGIAPFLTALRNSVSDLQLHEIRAAASRKGVPEESLESAFEQHGSLLGLVREFDLAACLRPVIPVMLWDCRSAFRLAINHEYKLNRETSGIRQPQIDPYTGELCPSVHEVFKFSRRALARALQCMGVAQFQAEGAEADDLAYQCTKAILSTDSQALITLHTEDTDWQQILALDEHRVAWWGMRERKEDKSYVQNANEEGARPWLTQSNYAQWTGMPSAAYALQVKALAGDPSDNVPGLDKVGQVRAREIMDTFGGWTQLLDKLQDASAAPAIYDWIGKAKWRRNCLIPQMRQRAVHALWQVDLGKAPRVTDTSDFWRSFSSNLPAPKSEEVTDRLRLPPLTRDMLRDWYQSLPEAGKAEVKAGIRGTVNGQGLQDLMQSLDCIPWFIPVDADPQAPAQAWLEPLHLCTTPRALQAAHRGLDAMLQALPHQAPSFYAALNECLAEGRKARDLTLAEMPEPADPAPVAKSYGRKKADSAENAATPTETDAAPGSLLAALAACPPAPMPEMQTSSATPKPH